jgi:hypothetical protein
VLLGTDLLSPDEVFLQHPLNPGSKL